MEKTNAVIRPQNNGDKQVIHQLRGQIILFLNEQI